MRKSICLISFSPIERDSRVLRQIKYLAPHYDLTVIGYGKPHAEWRQLPNIRWVPVQRLKPKIHLVLLYLLLGKIWLPAYERWYWLKPQHHQAYRYLQSAQYDAIYANEWDSLPLAANAVTSQKIPIIFDAHEYTIGEYRNVGILKKWLVPSAIAYLLRKYLPNVTASITVGETIAKKYVQEFGINPIVVLNVPGFAPISHRKVDPTNLKLIHHGVAKRGRHLENMIRALSLCDQRFTLYFMLIEHDNGYIKDLKILANKIAPGRVQFIDPVSPEKIVSTISQYDIGFFILKPVNESYLYALPNKFFDFIMAGLAACIGPSPEMAALVQKYKFGCIAPTFEPHDVAKILHQTSTPQWESMRSSAREAARELNAEKEMKKIITLVNQLLSSEP